MGWRISNSIIPANAPLASPTYVVCLQSFARPTSMFRILVGHRDGRSGPRYYACSRSRSVSIQLIDVVCASWPSFLRRSPCCERIERGASCP